MVSGEEMCRVIKRLQGVFADEVLVVKHQFNLQFLLFVHLE